MVTPEREPSWHNGEAWRMNPGPASRNLCRFESCRGNYRTVNSNWINLNPKKMDLSDYKKSLSEMTDEELLAQIAGTRNNRRNPTKKVSSKTKKIKVSKKKQEGLDFLKNLGLDV